MHLRSVLKDTPGLGRDGRGHGEGAVLAGSAEGATVLCTHMVDSRGGAFTVGLDLLTTITVIPRYNQWSEDKWHRTVRLAPHGMTVARASTSATAVIADESGWRTSGAGTVTSTATGTESSSTRSSRWRSADPTRGPGLSSR